MSKKLKELRLRQHDLKKEATALLDAADAADRDLSAEEESRYTAIEAELTSVAEGIVAEEARHERRRNLDAIATAAPPMQAATPVATVPAAPRNGNERNPAETNGFAHIADFARAVRTACTPETRHNVDQRLIGGRGVGAGPANYMEGGGTAGEGFELPVAFRTEIWDLVFDMDDIVQTTDIEPTVARQVEYMADETTPWGSSGVQAHWRSEGKQMEASKLGAKGRQMNLHEIYAFVLATEELLEDAPRLNSRLTTKSAEAINWKLNEAVIYGDGVGKPLGWFNSPALVSVAKEASQTGDTIVAQNVLKMYSRLWVTPGDQPYWITNRDTIPQLATITIGDKPVWMPPNGLISAPGGILLGYPVKFSEHGKTLGDKGDLQLVAPKGYYAAHRTQGVKFATSMHLYFDYNMQAFRWTFRFGGQPHLSAPIQPANGGSTKSCFVTLDERA